MSTSSRPSENHSLRPSASSRNFPQQKETQVQLRLHPNFFLSSTHDKSISLVLCKTFQEFFEPHQSIVDASRSLGTKKGPDSIPSLHKWTCSSFLVALICQLQYDLLHWLDLNFRDFRPWSAYLLPCLCSLPSLGSPSDDDNGFL